MQYRVQSLPKIPQRWGTKVYTPYPKRKLRPVSRKYPLATMDIGDSFLVPGRKRNALKVAVYKYRRTHEAWKNFTVRKVSATRCRCWRIQ